MKILKVSDGFDRETYDLSLEIHATVRSIELGLANTQNAFSNLCGNRKKSAKFYVWKKK